jgi:hypothetical protein
VHDSADKDVGKVAPYGVHHVTANAALVSLFITHDITIFAVASNHAELGRQAARPLADHATIIDLFAATTTTTGLKVEAVLDTTANEKGIKIRDAEMKHLKISGEARFIPNRIIRSPRGQTRSIYC